MSESESRFGYVLHNLVTGEDFSAYDEAAALAFTAAFPEDQDWSLWRVSKDGTSQATMVGVGRGPIPRG